MTRPNLCASLAALALLAGCGEAKKPQAPVAPRPVAICMTPSGVGS